jgi:multidrug efflux system outer membrane protein
VTASRFGVIGILLGAAAAGCAPATVPARPDVPLPAAFAQAPPGQSLAAQPFWEVFDDRALQDLIRTALDGNTDVQIAAARVLEARAAAGIARAGRLPTVTASLSAGGQRTPAIGNR